jgi:hypothetical protein
MTKTPQDDRYSDEESIGRVNKALKNVLHKSHQPLKAAKKAAKPKKIG